MSVPITWHLITGEYPNQPGGVSDYTRQIATGLAGRGHLVHVWAPDSHHGTAVDPGVFVHPLPDRFSWRTIRKLGKVLDAWDPPSRLFVQYVPHAFGCKGMNIPFARWLRRRRLPVWVMFHEVAYPWFKGQSWKHQFLGCVTHRMARWISLAAERSFVSIPSWSDMIRNVAPEARSAEWLPVPSVVPELDNPAAPAALRQSLGVPNEQTLVGHFGTYGPLITAILEPVCRQLLSTGTAKQMLLIGRNSEQFASRLSEFGGRIHAAGNLPPKLISTHLAACDLLVQPYPDGLSTRRTSLMAAMAAGLPVVSNHGFLSEPFWLDSESVLLTSVTDPLEIADLAKRALSDRSRLRVTGATALALYNERFSLNRTLDTLERTI